MGVYSKKIDSLDKLAKGATVGIPNDATNGGRALMVLESAGLLELKEGVGVTATERDIVKNLLNLEIKMMDAPMLPRALDDLDICVINSNYALEAKLNPVKDSIAMEPKDSPFANVLVVRAEDKDKETVKKLGAALQSPEVKQFLEETYQGACVPHSNRDHSTSRHGGRLTQFHKLHTVELNKHEAPFRFSGLNS